MAVPYTFGNATSSIPLSQLDNNFATAITIGNTAVQLGNTITTINNLTLANVTISSVATAVTSVEGGTGLTSVGTTGNVLTSNGTAWISQAPAASASSISNGTSNVSISSSNGNITAYTNGALAMTIDTNQNTTHVGTSVMGSSFLRNRIINGNMVIDQRNAGAAISAANLTSGSYTVDRWQYNSTQTAKFNAQQNQGSVTTPVGFPNYLGLTSQSAYSVTSTDFFSIRQPIEGFNAADWGWGTASAKTVTLSFLVYSSLTGTFGGSIYNYAGSRSYPFSYSVPSANTWTTISVTIAGDTSGTWTGNSSSGWGVIHFSLGAGSSVSGTAGSWSSTLYYSATSAVSVVGTSGATFYITSVQLEQGSVATPFERRQYGQELALCQRYFRKTGGATNQEPTFYGYGSNAQVVGQSWLYPVPMRASATATTSGTLQIAGATTITIVAGSDSYTLYVAPTSAVAQSISYQPNASYLISFSAEL